MRGSRRARKIFHECRGGSVHAALRQHGRLIERVALQRAGQRASHGDALRDFGEVEEAQINLTLSDQFAADCQRDVARLAFDLVEYSELGKRGARDGARGVGDRGIGICERARSEHGRLQLLGRRNVRDGPALLHYYTNTDARERYAAHRREVARFVVIVHRWHREDDGVERLLRELLVDVKRWADSKGHLMAGLPLEFSGDGLRRDLRRTNTEYTHLGSGGEGR